MVNIKLNHNLALRDIILAIEEGRLTKERKLFFFQVSDDTICAMEYLPACENGIINFWTDASNLVEEPFYCLISGNEAIDRLSHEYLNAREVFIDTIVFSRNPIAQKS